MKRILFALPLLALLGCSYLRSNTSRLVATNPTNGVVTVTEKTSARAYTLFDAHAELAKFSNRSGYTTNGAFGPGTYAAGINQTSSSSNLVDIISAIANGVAKGVVQGVK